jgi:hypothetical protein
MLIISFLLFLKSRGLFNAAAHQARFRIPPISGRLKMPNYSGHGKSGFQEIAFKIKRSLGGGRLPGHKKARREPGLCLSRKPEP